MPRSAAGRRKCIAAEEIGLRAGAELDSTGDAQMVVVDMPALGEVSAQYVLRRHRVVDVAVDDAQLARIRSRHMTFRPEGERCRYRRARSTTT